MNASLVNVPKTTNPIDPRLNDIAFLFTSTAKGNSSGIRVLMTVPDAQTWCTSPLSRGVIHGTEWAYFWTRAATWIRELGATLDITGFTDNGEWDDRFREAGVMTWTPLHRFRAVLEPLGVHVIDGTPRPAAPAPDRPVLEQLDMFGEVA